MTKQDYYWYTTPEGMLFYDTLQESIGKALCHLRANRARNEVRIFGSEYRHVATATRRGNYYGMDATPEESKLVTEGI